MESDKKGNVIINASENGTETSQTSRFTLGTETGGRGRVKRRDTKKLEEEEEM